MSAITAKASRKMKKYAVLTREPRCFLGSFDFSWEQRKAKELFVSTADKGYPELPVLSATQDRGMIRRDENSINIFHDKKNEAGYKRVLPGQFVIHLRSFQGGFAHSAIEGITSPAYTVFGFSEPEKHDSEYWKYVFTSKSFIRRLETVTYGIRDGRSISYEEFLTLGFVYPSKAEQTAIARYLDKLSDLITLHQRKCALLFSPFQALISMMFTTSTFSWEQRKLGDIADIVGGGTPSTGNPNYWDGDIDWYAPAEIASQIYANSSQKKITDLGYENSSAKMLPPGTVLFTSRAGIGKTAILARKGCTNQGFQSIVPHRGELDSYFIFSRTEELKRYGELVGAGSTFVEVSGKQMAVMELMMPPTMREQQTIGGFFQQLDHLITLHQRECISFTGRAGSLILTANKKRTTSSWEQRKVSDLAEKTYGGGTPTTSNEAYWNGDIPWIQSSDVVDGKLLGVEPRKRITQDGLNNSAAQLIPENSIAIITRVGVGKLAFMPYSYATSQDFLSLSKLNTAPLFTVYACYKKLQSELNAVQGTSIKGITKDELLAKSIMVPQYAEQRQIGAYFKQLDHLITLHQRKPFLMKWRTSDANRNQTNRLVL